MVETRDMTGGNIDIAAARVYVAGLTQSELDHTGIVAMVGTGDE